MSLSAYHYQSLVKMASKYAEIRTEETTQAQDDLMLASAMIALDIPDNDRDTAKSVLFSEQDWYLASKIAFIKDVRKYANIPLNQAKELVDRMYAEGYRVQEYRIPYLDELEA